jgi:putative PEP-CTERM system histidine kinase
LASFLFCSAIVLAVVIRRRWNPTSLSLLAGMASLAFVEVSNFFALTVSTPEEMVFWTQTSLAGEVFFGGNWLLVSLIFAKGPNRVALKMWRWAIPMAYLLPGAALVFLLSMDQGMIFQTPRIITLAPFAKWFHLSLLIVAILVLMNLESTFRSSFGPERWRIKYMIFGVASLVSAYIYVLSQRLLYNAVKISDTHVFSAVILVANMLILYSVIRKNIVDGDIYVSRKVIYSSISLIALGVYSVLVGVSAQILKSLDLHEEIKLDVLLIFFAALAVIVFFNKDSFRRRIKAVINRNFKKSKYVFRDEWMFFSTELSKKISTREICESFLKTLAARMFVRHTSIWLSDDRQVSFNMVESRNIEEKPEIRISLHDMVIEYLYARNHPLSKTEILSNKDLTPTTREIAVLFETTKAELIVPLILAERWVGLLTMGKIRGGEPYDETEDYDLLKSAAAHAASAINNARLFEERMRANEMEAFHRLSSFVMHDLKNMTSMLSIVAQNAEKHLHNPEFQKDALKTISEAVARMRKMIHSLSDLPDQLKLQVKSLDFNELISDALEKICCSVEDLKIETRLGQLPQVRVDPDEIRKVIDNLLLNAHEALDGEGFVKVATEAKGEHVVFSVCDNGTGMSKDFVENLLFQPFKSTKKKGLGIGLYQCKAIIEAHGGRIDVVSEPGKGSTFSVYLPAK